MNVLVATGQKELDQFISQLTKSPIPPVAYQEGVTMLCERYKPDIVVLSAFLDGNMRTEDVLYQLRKNGARVIVLIGHTETNVIREKWIPLGVYDYISDPVTEEKIRFSLEYPATLGMAEERLQMIDRGEDEKEEEPEQKKSLFKRRKKREDKKVNKSWASNREVHSNEQPFLWQTQGSQSPPQQPSHRETTQQEPVQWGFEQKTEETPSFGEVPSLKDKKEVSADADEPMENNNKNDNEPSIEETNKKTEESPRTDEVHSVWNFQSFQPYQPALPEAGYNIVVLSPVPAGKTYIAINLAAVLSKQGAKTELVAFEGHDDIWQYLDLPMMEPGTPQGLPNLTVSPFKKINHQAQYRIIDLPYEYWDQAKNWHDALFLYVTDMDVVHNRKAERLKDEWQGRKILNILNGFVSNVLDGGQEQKIRLNADIVFNDQPNHYLAMRFNRPVAITEQSAAREFEMAVKTVQGALPSAGQNNVFSIG